MGSPLAAASPNGLTVSTECGSCCFVNMGTNGEHRLVGGSQPAEIKTWKEKEAFQPVSARNCTAEQARKQRRQVATDTPSCRGLAADVLGCTSLKLALPAQPRASTGGLIPGPPRHPAERRPEGGEAGATPTLPGSGSRLLPR